MRCVLVFTFHWDREWYRTYEGFRARLVDTMDNILAMLESDADYRFMLDGQTVILEDYLEVRPQRSTDVRKFVSGGRLAQGPWYVQPDCLMPSGEAIIRNLLEGRRVGKTYGPVSRVAYTPDSFGHPAQLPRILSDFGLQAFIYWRGNNQEVQRLPSEYLWLAPDGTGIVACHLRHEYSWVPNFEMDEGRIITELKNMAELKKQDTRSDQVLVIRGGDHVIPERHSDRIATGLAKQIGGDVMRGSLEDFVGGLPTEDLPVYRGELLGAASAPLLSGVWSTRTYLKLENRATEAALEGWAEPWAALAHVLGGPDERPSLRMAWRSLLQNQAHDSICGCSADAVHNQMSARYDSARELANETVTRCMELIAGLGTQRRSPWTDNLEIAVFNPSPHRRTDVVHFPLETWPAWEIPEQPPVMKMSLTAEGFTVDGKPARPIPADSRCRLKRNPEDVPRDIEFVATDVPAFGYRTFRLARGPAYDDDVDSGTRISNGSITVIANTDDGTLSVSAGGRTFMGLCGIEDIGDRGDAFDFDPVVGKARVRSVDIERSQHASGIAVLRVTRHLAVPALSMNRQARLKRTQSATVTTMASVYPNVSRVDIDVAVRNAATDHRLRLLFPTGSKLTEFMAATTFDTVSRSPQLPDDTDWVQAATGTFPCQGWVSANDLMVIAPGLYEVEVTADGMIALTLLRAVGTMSRPDLKSRPFSAGPALATPAAQCLRDTEARLALAVGPDPRVARDFELGLRAVIAGDRKLLPPGLDTLVLEPRALLMSAFKPTEEGDGVVVRVFNPTDTDQVASLTTSVFEGVGAIAVRADETQCDEQVDVDHGRVVFDVPAHAIRSIRLELRHV